MNTANISSSASNATDYDIMQNVVNEAKIHSVKEMQLTKQYQKQNAFIKTQIKIFVGICLYVLFLILLNRLKIYMTFKDMIKFINNNQPYQQGAPSELRSGYKIAYFYMNPNLNRNNFNNTSFPTSVVYSFYTWPEQFYENAKGGASHTTNLVDMYNYSVKNSNDSANQIICGTWGQGFSGCQVACHVFPKVDVFDYITSALGGGMAGGFAAHGMEMGGGVAAGGVLIVGAISAWTTYADAQDNKERCQSQQNCAHKSC